MKNKAAQALAKKHVEKYPEMHTQDRMKQIAKLPRKKKKKDEFTAENK